MEISCIDGVKNEVKHMVKKEINILHNWIDQILPKNCLLKRAIERKAEGKVEVTGIRGRRRKQLVDDLKENRRC